MLVPIWVSLLIVAVFVLFLMLCGWVAFVEGDWWKGFKQTRFGRMWIENWPAWAWMVFAFGGIGILFLIDG